MRYRMGFSCYRMGFYEFALAVFQKWIAYDRERTERERITFIIHISFDYVHHDHLARVPLLAFHGRGH